MHEFTKGASVIMGGLWVGLGPAGAAECCDAVRNRQSGLCLAPPGGVLHGLAAPDWRGGIRVARTLIYLSVGY